MDESTLMIKSNSFIISSTIHLTNQKYKQNLVRCLMLINCILNWSNFSTAWGKKNCQPNSKNCFKPATYALHKKLLNIDISDSFISFIFWSMRSYYTIIIKLINVKMLIIINMLLITAEVQKRVFLVYYVICLTCLFLDAAIIF